MKQRRNIQTKLGCEFSTNVAHNRYEKKEENQRHSNDWYYIVNVAQKDEDDTRAHRVRAPEKHQQSIAYNESKADNAFTRITKKQQLVSKQQFHFQRTNT